MAAVAVVLVPVTAGAVYSATTATSSSTLSAARWYSCALAAAGSSASAAYAFQDVSGNIARNTGTAGTVADGTFSGGVAPTSAGPARCGAGGTRAVTFDGTTGAMVTSYAVENPQFFSVQLWFATTTSDGGKLIGFGDNAAGADGAGPAEHDRHVHMTNSGKLTFGVYDAATYEIQTTTTPGSYNDGAWHLVTATFSPPRHRAAAVRRRGRAGRPQGSHHRRGDDRVLARRLRHDPPLMARQAEQRALPELDRPREHLQHPGAERRRGRRPAPGRQLTRARADHRLAGGSMSR